jgi:hypothetical protein
MAKYAQKITHFYCWRCKEYHEKTHPHYRSQKRRLAKRRKQAETETEKKGE